VVLRIDIFDAGFAAPQGIPLFAGSTKCGFGLAFLSCSMGIPQRAAQAGDYSIADAAGPGGELVRLRADVSRLDLLHALVVQGTVSIDAYHENTPDKAAYDGHYYSDKAPGTGALALLRNAVAVRLLHRIGEDTEGTASRQYLLRDLEGWHPKKAERGVYGWQCGGGG
jgi:hypothetical protein